MEVRLWSISIVYIKLCCLFILGLKLYQVQNINNMLNRYHSKFRCSLLLKYILNAVLAHGINEGQVIPIPEFNLRIYWQNNSVNSLVQSSFSRGYWPVSLMGFEVEMKERERRIVRSGLSFHIHTHTQPLSLSLIQTHSLFLSHTHKPSLSFFDQLKSLLGISWVWLDTAAHSIRA